MRMKVKTIGLLTGLGSCLGLAGCKSTGAGWEFGIQTAGFTIRYDNHADSAGEYKFVQTFDPEGADIVLNGIKELLQGEPEEKSDNGGSSSDSNGIQ